MRIVPTTIIVWNHLYRYFPKRVSFHAKIRTISNGVDSLTFHHQTDAIYVEKIQILNDSFRCIRRRGAITDAFRWLKNVLLGRVIGLELPELRGVFARTGRNIFFHYYSIKWHAIFRFNI